MTPYMYSISLMQQLRLMQWLLKMTNQGKYFTRMQSKCSDSQYVGADIIDRFGVYALSLHPPLITLT